MSSRVIILEGPDGGGKTTLAQTLRAKYGYEVLKTNAPRPGEDLFEAYTTSLLQAVGHHRPVVLDRHYLGEGVYGPVKRGEDRLGAQGRDLLERVVAARGVRLVLVCPRWTTLLRSWQQKTEDYLKTVKELEAITHAYCAEEHRLRCTTWDWELSSLVDLMALLEPLPSLPHFMTGYPGAEVLVVGERFNSNRGTPWDLPFHRLGDCSTYLWESLRKAEIPEASLAWMNAYDVNGRSNNLDLAWASLPNLRRVVCLGSQAAALVTCSPAHKVLEPLVHKVPHPQFHKRFKAKESYADLLKEAIQ